MSNPQQRLKILHVIRSVDPAGGGPIEGIRRQNDATRHLAEREVVCLDSPDAPHLSTFPMRVHALGTAFQTGPLAHYGYSPALAPWLRSHAPEYDAVIVNGLWNYASFGASLALPQLKTPYFVFPHGMMDPWFRRASPAKHFAKQAFWSVGEGRLLAGARAVLFTSEEEQRAARGVFWGHKYREQVVGYGTAPPPVEAQDQIEAFTRTVPDLGGRPYLLFLSRIHPKKGCDLLIKAFAQIADQAGDLQLVIAGPDEIGSADALRELASSLGIGGRIHWPGMLQGGAKWGAFRGAQAFILPSHQENFGIVVAESLACGLPVLISDKVNIWREISAAGAGLVETDTQAGVSRMLEDWLSIGPLERASMGEKAKTLFDTKFDVAATGPATIAQMERLS